MSELMKIFEKLKSDFARLTEENENLKHLMLNKISDVDASVLVHSLQVYHIELEMQNRELQEVYTRLEEVNLKYLELYDFAPIGYITLNLNGIILESNLTAAKQIGVDRSILIKTPFSKYMEAKCADKLHLHIKKIYATKGRDSCDVTLITSSGYVYAHIESVFMEDIDLSGVCRTTITDISKQKEKEKELMDSDTRWQYALCGSGDGVWDWNIETNKVFYSKQWKSMLGYEEDEINDDLVSWEVLIHPDDRAKVYNEMEKFLSQKDVLYETEHRIKCKNGSYKWILNRGKMISYDEEMKPMRAIGTHTDIDRIKKAETNANRIQKELETIIDTSPIMIFYKDSNNTFIRVNKSLATACGLTRDAMEGKSLSELFPIMHDKYLSDDIEVISTGLSKLNILEEMYTSDGEKYIVNTHKIPYKDCNGNVIGIIGFSTNITEQIKTTKELIESKQLLLDVINSMPDPTFVIDTSGVIIFWNKSMEVMSGRKSAEMVGKGNYEYSFLLYGERTPVLIDYALNEESILGHRYSSLKKKDTVTEVISHINSELLGEVYLFGSANPLYDSSGTLIGAIESVRDISEIKRNEALLKLNDERLESLVKLSQYPTNNIQELLDLTLEEAIKLTNSKFGYIYHYNEKTQEFNLNSWSRNVMDSCTIIDQKKCYDLSSTGIWGEVVRQKKTIILNKFQENHKLKKGYPEGHAELYRYMSVPVFFDNKIVSVVGIANKENDYDEHDARQLYLLMDSVWKIVKQRAAQNALVDSEHKLKAMFEQAAVGIIEVDINTLEYITANTGFLGLVGYEIDELLTKNIKELTHKDDIVINLKKLEELKNGKFRTFSMEKRFINKNGNAIWTNITFSAMWDVDEKPTSYIGIVEDITDRKKIEEEKKKIESQLRQVQKMDAIGTLAGGIAHDFNNILSAIVGYTEVALATVTKNSPVFDDLDNVLISAHRAKDLVRQILTFGRKEKNETKKFIDVNMNNIVKETMRFLRITIPSTIEIKLNISEENIIVKSEDSQISQILVNLCTNANHAMSKNGGILELKLESLYIDNELMHVHPNLVNGLYACLSISDTGHGMDQATIEKIFDPYFTTKPIDEGTGIGLSIVSSVVSRHSGVITVYSELNNGSVFKIYIPCKIAAATSSSEILSDEIDNINYKISKHILFVDDEEILATMGTRLLEFLGHTSISTTSSIDALELFSKDPYKFDLIITDYSMPKMNGIDFSRKVRKIRANIPIILCTGFSEHITEEKAKELGINAFIMKPMTMKSITDVIRDIFKSDEA